ncbi:polymeric immunoglobulin receptor isoform X2 [Pseudoliparis swirei]|uniref:polymeric immunoglobulin receptor isoform X2 n=1 Tax=Pseudoliparis swirei TaxID=2059687 RepID=UPI0024BD755E|nr:polymeric immunoglobulin receptor isoform X2 [Pseudoliparis swirei]
MDPSLPLQGNHRRRARSHGGPIPHNPVSLRPSVRRLCEVLVPGEDEGVLHQLGPNRPGHSGGEEGMSVVNSRLSGEEGSSVTVECHYSERYRDSEKKWCRSGDWRTCLLTGADGSYEDPSVALSDDRSWTFTITLKELRMRDSGWYWCSVGAQQMLVQVLVTPRPTTTAATETSPPTPSQSAVLLPPPEPITEQSRSSHRHILEALLVCASIVVLVGLALLARKLWRRHRRDPVQGQLNWIKARHNEFSGEVSDPQSTGVAFLNADTQDVHMY